MQLVGFLSSTVMQGGQKLPRFATAENKSRITFSAKMEKRNFSCVSSIPVT